MAKQQKPKDQMVPMEEWLKAWKDRDSQIAEGFKKIPSFSDVKFSHTDEEIAEQWGALR
jgi:hypothetical protein